MTAVITIRELLFTRFFVVHQRLIYTWALYTTSMNGVSVAFCNFYPTLEQSFRLFSGAEMFLWLMILSSNNYILEQIDFYLEW